MKAWTNILLWSCLAISPLLAQNTIYWTDSGAGKLQRASSDGAFVQTLVQRPAINNPVALVINPGIRLYMGDGNRIYQAGLDGNGLEVFLGTGITNVTALAIGPDGKLYWTDSNGAVMRAKTDKTQVDTFLRKTQVNNPGALVFDPATAKWYIGDGNRILRVDTNGANLTVLIGTGLTQVSDLVIGTDQKLYWTDRGANRVSRAKSDGSQVEQLLGPSAVSAPEAVAIDNGTSPVTMLVASGNRILRANLDGTNAQPLVDKDLSVVSDIDLQPGPLCIPVFIVKQPEDTAVCEGQSVFFGVQVGGTKPYQFQWRKNGLNITGATSDTLRLPAVALTDAGQYDCVIRNNCGTVTTRKAELKVYPKPDAKIVPDRQPPELCRGTALKLEGRITGGSPAYQFRWLGDTMFLQPPIGQTSTFKADTFGMFQILFKATDSRGCYDQDTIRITVFDNPKASITATPNAVCQGDPIQLNGNPTGGSGTYTQHQWTVSSGGSLSAANIVNPVFSASAAGVYTLTYKVKDSRGCESTTVTTTVRVNAKPTVTLTTNSPVCAGATLQLNATVSGGSGTYSFNWTGPGGFASTVQNPAITPAGVQHTGTFKVTVTDATTGCTREASINATVFQVEVKASVGRTICLGDSVVMRATATGGTAPYTFQWFVGSVSPANLVGTFDYLPLRPTITNQYIVVARDANQCQDADTTIVRISDPTVTITPSRTVVCEGNTVTLTGNVTGGVPGYSFRWSHDLGILGTVTVNPRQTTTYSLTVTDFIGCVDSARITITVDIPAVTITADNAIVCPGNPVRLTAAATAGTAPFTFTWNKGTTQNADGSVILDNPTSETTYKVTMEDAVGCLATATFTVRVHDAPQVSAWTSKVICPGEKITIQTNVTKGRPPFTYQWTGNLAGATPIVDPKVTTTYKLTVTDANNCQGFASALVEVYPEHKVTAGSNQPICEGQDLKLTATAEGDAGGFNYNWTGPGGFTSQSQNPVIAAAKSTNAGTYTVEVTGKTTGCKAKADIQVFVYAAPQITINGPTDVCEGVSLALQANLAAGDPNDYDFTWTTPDGKTWTEQNLPIPDVQLKQAGKYTVTVTLKGNASCTASASHDLKVHPKPRVALATDKTLPICRKTDITVTATFTDEKGAPLAVSNVTRFLDGQQITGLRYIGPQNTSEVFNLPGEKLDKTKTFRVVAKDDNQCEGEASIQITVIGPDLKLSLDKTDACEGDQLLASTTYSAGTNPKFTWTAFLADVKPLPPDQSTATVDLTTATHLGISPSVTVSLTDDSGCKATESQTIKAWAKPKFDIIADPPKVCKDQEVKLKTNYLEPFGSTTEYKWSTGGTEKEITLTNPTSTATYRVTVTLVSASGTKCSESNFIQLEVGTLNVSITSNTTNLCPGSEVILTAEAEGAKDPKYNWDNGETGKTRKVAPNIETIYRVTVTDDKCQGDARIIVSRYDYKVQVIATPTTVCAKEKVVLEAKVTSAGEDVTKSLSVNISWPQLGKTGAGPIEVFPEKTETYKAELATVYGCSFTGERTVNVASQGEKLDVKSKVTSASCTGKGGGKVELTVSGGTGNYQVSWSDGGSGLTRSDLKAGSYQYTVTSGSGNCKSTANGSVSVSEPSPLKLSVNGSSNLSFTLAQNIPQIELTASASGGTEPYTFSWPGGSKTITGPGDYPLNVTDAGGCSASATVQVRRTTIVVSRDPNDILGPEGYGDPRWVSVNDVLPYTIRFENDPKFATAPAQKVVVEHHPDPSLNLFSMRLGDFGFANQRFKVPANTTFYSERLNLTDSLGILVDVTAGIDVTTNKIFWIFESVDPKTGLPPTNPQLGLLPINDKQTHRGEGFVNFVIRPQKSAPTGDSVLAKAEIVFDINEKIGTPEIFNVIDALAPVSRVTDTSFAVIDVPVVTLAWTGADDPGGSGIRNYSLYVSDEGGPFTAFKEGIAGTGIEFPGTPGHTYRFYVRATDNTGNVEPEKTKAEKTVRLNDLPAVALYGILNRYCAGDSVIVQWAATRVKAIDLLFYPGSGKALEMLGKALPASTGLFKWKTPGTFSGCTDCAVIIRDTTTGSALRDTAFLAIKARPAVNAGPDQVVCAGSTATLQGSGAATYRWSPAQGLSNTQIANPVATITGFTTYYLEGRDTFGCVNQDSVSLAYTTAKETRLTALTCNPKQVGVGFRKFAASSGCDSLVFTEYILDTIPPVIQCNAKPSFRLDTTGQLILTAAMLAPYYSDNCPAAQVLFSPSFFTCADTGMQALRLTVFDSVGKSASCTLSIRILPSSFCKVRLVNTEGATVTTPCACRGDGVFDEEVTVISVPGETWRIDSTTLVNPATQRPYPAGTALVEKPAGSGRYRLTGIHRSGIGYVARVKSPAYPGLVFRLSDTCYYPDVRILDLSPAYCQTNTPVLLKGTAGGVAGTGSFTIDGKAAIRLVPDSLGKGDHVVAYRFDAGTARPGDPTDPGCVTTAKATVSIEGKGHPVCGGQGNFFTFAYLGEDTFSVGDNCAFPLSLEAIKPFLVANYQPEQVLARFSFDPGLTGYKVGDPIPVNTIVRMTYTAEDNYGNRDTFAFNLTFVDKLPPVMKCKPATVSLQANGAATLDPALVNDKSFDGCGIKQLSLNRSTFTCQDLGPQQVRLTGSDIYGNTASCLTTVTVADPIAPKAVCRDTVIYLDATGKATLPAGWVNAGSSDNCGIASTTLSRSRFDSLDIGKQQVTLTVTDLAGNKDSCRAAVTVLAKPTDVLELPDFAQAIRIYPNPAADWLTVEVDLFKKETLYFEMTNTIGQSVYLQKVDAVSTAKQEFDLKGWPSGLYLLSISNAEGSKVSVKVIRQAF